MNITYTLPITEAVAPVALGAMSEFAGPDLDIMDITLEGVNAQALMGGGSLLGHLLPGNGVVRFSTQIQDLHLKVLGAIEGAQEE